MECPVYTISRRFPLVARRIQARLLLGAIQVLARRYDRDAAMGDKGKKVFVSRDDEVRIAGGSAFKNEVVLWVAASASEDSGHGNPSALLKKLGELLPHLVWINLKLLLHDPYNFIFQLRACQNVVIVQAVRDG